MKHFDNKIYLLKVDTPDKRLYKIGSTRNSVKKRIQALQTGCPYEIHLVEYYESKFGQTLERTFHNRFKHKQTFGEWFSLDLMEEFDFKEMCMNLETINEQLINNNL